jgi:hypothetical protein
VPADQLGRGKATRNLAPRQVGTLKGAGLHSESQPIQQTGLAVHLRDHGNSLLMQSQGKIGKGLAVGDGCTNLRAECISDDCRY